MNSSELTWTTLQNPAFKERKGRERKEKEGEGEGEGEGGVRGRGRGKEKERKGKEGKGEGEGKGGGGKEVGNRRKVGRQVIPCQLGPDFRTSA